MDEVLRYHGILRRMDSAEKIGIIRGLITGGEGDVENYEILFDLLGDPNYDFRRAAYNELKKVGSVILESTTELLKKGNDDQKYWAAQLLVNMGGQAVSALELVLKEDDQVIKRLAVQTLGELRAKSSVKHLMELLSDDNWALRQEAFKALQGYGEAIFKEACQKLKSDNEDHVYWAVKLLGAMGHRSRKVLMDAMQSKKPEVKFVIATALGKNGEPQILDMLVKMFVKGTPWLYSKGASDALAQIGQPAISAVLDILKQSKAADSYWPIYTLLQIGEEAIERLSDFFCSSDETWLWDCREVLNKIELPLLPLISRLIEDGGQKVRYFGYSLIVEQSDEDIIDQMFVGLKDDYWPTRQLCATALVKGGDLAVSRLKPMLNSATAQQLFWYIEVLKHTDSGRILLVDCLRGEDKSVLSLVAVALRGNVPREAIVPLLHCLENKNWVVRRDAAATLISAGTDGLEKVVESLSLNEPEFQYWLKYILGSYPKSVYPHLSALLYRENYPVQLAAMAMGLIKDSYFVPALQEVLKEQNELLVLQATWALSEILPDQEIKSVWGLLSMLSVKEHHVLQQIIERYSNEAVTYILSGLRSAETCYVCNSIYLCGQMQLQEAVPRLKELLFGSNMEWAMFAADALMDLRCREVIPDFRRLLETQVEARFRLKLLSVLGVLDEGEVVPLILKILKGARNEDEKNQFSQEVFKMGIEVLPQLIRAFDSQDPALRKIAAELLLEYGGLAVPLLKEESASGTPNGRFWSAKVLRAYYSEIPS